MNNLNVTFRGKREQAGILKRLNAILKLQMLWGHLLMTHRKLCLSSFRVVFEKRFCFNSCYSTKIGYTLIGCLMVMSVDVAFLTCYTK